MQTIYQVGEPGSEAQFNSIQAAIDQALLDGHDNVDDPAVVEILPGIYTEDFSLHRGLTVRAFSQRTYIQETVETVRVRGTVTVDLTLDGTRERTVARMNGIEISPASGPGIVFTGSDPSLLNLDTVTVNALDDVAIRVENTGVGSAVQSNDSVFRASAGNPGPAAEVSAGQFLVLFGFVEKELASDTAVLVTGGIYTFVFGRQLGDIDLDGGEAQQLNTFVEVAGQPVADIAAGATLLVSNSTYIGAPVGTDLLTGDGLVLFGTVTVTGGTIVFPPSLSVVSLPYGQPMGVLYTPGSPGDWAGTPPTNMQEFADRIASAVAGLLGGAIP